MGTRFLKVPNVILLKIHLREEHIGNPMFNLVVVGFIFMGFIHKGVMETDGTPYVPAIFVFGDSLADTGNNNFIPNCQVRANFTPYGISAFPHPTGRFSDGLITFDYLGTLLRVPSPDLLLSQHKNFSRGINFASAGSGLLNSTGETKNVMPLSKQIENFRNISNMFIKEEESKHPHGAEEAKAFIANSLFCIAIGSNDIANYFTLPPFEISMNQLSLELVNASDQHLLGLYNSGARKFLLANVPALGCTPYARTFSYYCHFPANDLSVKYNSLLKKLVDHLNENLQGASIVLLDSYTQVMDMIIHGESYGFVETKEACCGSGAFNAQQQCGLTTPPNQYCKDPDKYLFWDWGHPTQKAAEIFANAIWSGDSSIMHPFNLSTLVLARN